MEETAPVGGATYSGFRTNYCRRRDFRVLPWVHQLRRYTVGYGGLLRSNFARLLALRPSTLGRIHSQVAFCRQSAQHVPITDTWQYRSPGCGRRTLQEKRCSSNARHDTREHRIPVIFLRRDSPCASQADPIILQWCVIHGHERLHRWAQLKLWQAEEINVSHLSGHPRIFVLPVRCGLCPRALVAAMFQCGSRPLPAEKRCLSHLSLLPPGGHQSLAGPSAKAHHCGAMRVHKTLVEWRQNQNFKQI